MPIIYEPKGRAAEYAYLAANLYEGCDHNCTYCYVPGMPQWRDKDFYGLPAAPREGVVAKIRQQAAGLAGTDKRVLLCFACDPYPAIETEHNITRQVLWIFHEYNIPFAVLSKSGTRACRDLTAYGENDTFGVTLTTMNEGLARQTEPGAAIPRSRMLALEMAKAAGIKTWVSLEPVLDAEASLEVIRKTAHATDLFKIGKLNHMLSDTDWAKFAKDAIATCRRAETNYFIKKDLAAYLDGFPFCNIDDRIVKR